MAQLALLKSVFARYSRMLYVEPYLALRPTLADWRTGQLSLTHWIWPAVSPLDAELYVYYQPPFAPVTGPPVLGATTRGARRRLLSGALARLGLQRPIVDLAAVGGRPGAQ